MAKCYACDKEAEDRFLYNRFSFGVEVGKKRMQFKAQWMGDENKDIVVCQRCCANLLENFAKGLMESLPEKSRRFQ